MNNVKRSFLIESASGTQPTGRIHRIGLGIDAGGTYTDAVIYDFIGECVIAKAKSLTTKWKYSEGIMKAVDSLPSEQKKLIDLISVSTTLVTNAVVESKRRPVGLLLMPNGKDRPEDLKHEPTGVIRGRMTIGGDLTEEIDSEEILNTIRRMISHFHVEAFAVSGYGGAVNPLLELQVKELVRDESGMEVCCGHELSGSLNFAVRAVTAVLNAGVMPIMEDFLKEMELSIAAAGINAPLLVVRGDGAVMSESYAREFPVQTALSGPAASMAGAIFLSSGKDALVIDVGGTTSDIGIIENGRVSVCDEGARIGEWDTHVKAVDMLTTGLGGDSEILFDRQRWILGPKRITPISWLAGNGYVERSLEKSLEYAGALITDWAETTVPLQFLYRTGKKPDFKLTSGEQKIFDALDDSPLMICQIQKQIGSGSWRNVKSLRLENSYCIQRAGLTPTDIFHQEGRLSLWNRDYASSYIELITGSVGMDSAELARRIRTMISEKLGTALLLKMLGKDISPGSGIDVILGHGNQLVELSPEIRIPVIGLGAPAELMLGDVMEKLNGKLILCENGDVANAIGAVTSKVTVARTARVAATTLGGFRIHGLEGEIQHYKFLKEAENRCIEVLVEQVRKHSRKAGTSESEVNIAIETNVAKTTDGSEIFIEMIINAEISGIPDLF